MVQHVVNPPADGWNLTLPSGLWDELKAHLFRDDDDEHGAVILAGLTSGPRGPRLLGRELVRAVDGVDYVEGTFGARALAPEFVRDMAVRARDEQLAYIAVHNHFGSSHVGFSRIDLASQERGYPALRQITGQVIGGLVLTPYAAAGDLWLPDGSRVALAETVITGNNLIRLRPQPAPVRSAARDGSRQALLFGDRGQETLGRLRVAVVGLGGVGSLKVELLARLGVGHLVLIEPEHADETNLPRLVAAGHDDVGKLKTELAARNAIRAKPDIQLQIINDRVESPAAREALSRCDWIFLAADSASARFWVNSTVHRYLIPATQAGVKIPVDADGTVGRIHTATRFLLPGRSCMRCNGLIDPTDLAIDMHPDDERKRARYVDGVPAASVIALNNLAVAEAVDHFMLAVTSLHTDDDLYDTVHFPRQRDHISQEATHDPTCSACSRTGSLGAGDQSMSRRLKAMNA